MPLINHQFLISKLDWMSRDANIDIAVWNLEKLEPIFFYSIHNKCIFSWNKKVFLLSNRYVGVLTWVAWRTFDRYACTEYSVTFVRR